MGSIKQILTDLLEAVLPQQPRLVPGTVIRHNGIKFIFSLRSQI